MQGMAEHREKIGKIAVAGVGYVGLSLAALLARKHTVYATCRHQAKADMLKGGYTMVILPKVAQDYDYKSIENSLVSCFKRIQR